MSDQDFPETVRTLRGRTAKGYTGIGSVDSWRQDMYRKILLGKAPWQSFVMDIHDQFMTFPYVSYCFNASISLHRFPVLVCHCARPFGNAWTTSGSSIRQSSGELRMKAWQKDSCYIQSNVATPDILPLSTRSCQSQQAWHAMRRTKRVKMPFTKKKIEATHVAMAQVGF